MEIFFKELFEYNQHYNLALNKVMLENPDRLSAKCMELFCHILNAHQIWNNRIQHNGKSFGIREIHGLQHLQAIDQDNHTATAHILETKELAAMIDYATMKGDIFTHSIRDILFHVINHSTYHRAQIATEFRQCGLEPVMTDYMFYKMTGH
ncbi:MAG: DinB family protein [Agriterribacter sp.]